MRLDKFLADLGYGTRSEVKNFIKKGNITVNGTKINKPEFKIDENKDEIMYNNQIIEYKKYQYFLLNKPSGCVTATNDNVHKTVMDYLEAETKKYKNLSPVGRLDKDTEGLLLITNDGLLSHDLLSPSHHVAKKYYVELDGQVDESLIEEFKRGVDIGDDKLTKPAELEILKPNNTAYLTIIEGRFHQVKRMFAAKNLKVTYLKRVEMSILNLEGLEKGEYRALTNAEIEVLHSNKK
ncbi:pseudouridine synthase [Lachnobacterium bovis]|uniref:Pseudouridine synthase n=1 Tax=Lachnobacterium bovis TaxID=140626 RepID=A0A1H9QQ17_9FIRM|nr:pseudouridine synthase [Lachnobacterium bovis]SER62510.1 16S rRNA pseudouridine516 synthase [Lachnobacterium bovis]